MGVRRFITDFFNKMDSVDRLFDPQGAKLDALDKELQARFPDTYTFFSEEEKKDLLTMTVGERLDYYATLQPKFAALDPQTRTAGHEKSESIHPFAAALRKFENAQECIEAANARKARIRTEYANDPAEMQRLLDIIDNLLMRHRAEHGW